jgi:hypothetical protein
MYTYWVDYEYSYYYLEDGNWNYDFGGNGQRFQCRKKEIKKEIEKYLREEEFLGTEIKDVKIRIIDSYITTDCEV